MVDAVARGDDDAALAVMHPDIEWHATGAFLEQPVYRGLDELRGFLGLFRENFEDFRVEAEPIAEREDAVLIGGRIVGRGRGSGLEVDVPRSWLCLLRDDKIVHVRTFETLEEGRRALEEVPPQQ
jgi:ketosteroid isomerase-like protein